ncbi:MULTISPECIES: NlpC/P60 family protein [unclassified Paenibacillus]|uniref:C40 family peptidase n=1 Tax=Paenibacillus provencensis TaxID=441151 RepID=A0ABW3PZ43_9BACL|nr:MULTISPECIES: NlpC/P60 family protein [unclassified Paenibacillus]MCM3126392.1 NlpC/P60 family protein [Paenibacillus sp. MER 78]SFS60520.1 peptidoglycan endopeptidase LytE [Paenibacillus sp. 453mf]
MKKFGKYMLFSSLLAAGLIMGNGQADASSSSTNTVNIQVNSNLIDFPDAEPFLDQNYSTQVPVRMLADEMNYTIKVFKSGKETVVKLSKGGTTIRIQTNQTTAVVNSSKVSLGTQVFIRNDRTYVPIRFVSEAMGYDVTWKKDLMLAMISTTGKTYSPALVPNDHVKGTSIVNEAMKHIGVPYVYGGSTTSGFDCSGLVKYVFDKYGVSLPRTAATQYNQGSSVSKGNLQQGDLVFFKTTGSSISHVGIYVGNNNFISATSSSGVKIDSLDNTYWGPKYAGAKRVL